MISMFVYIDKYQYVSENSGTPNERSPEMDTNLAAWMISGGNLPESHATQLEREQLHAFRESQRVANAGRPSVVERLRSFVRPTAASPEGACCPA